MVKLVGVEDAEIILKERDGVKLFGNFDNLERRLTNKISQNTLTVLSNKQIIKIEKHLAI